MRRTEMGRFSDTRRVALFCGLSNLTKLDYTVPSKIPKLGEEVSELRRNHAARLRR